MPNLYCFQINGNYIKYDGSNITNYTGNYNTPVLGTVLAISLNGAIYNLQTQQTLTTPRYRRHLFYSISGDFAVINGKINPVRSIVISQITSSSNIQVKAETFSGANECNIYASSSIFVDSNFLITQHSRRLLATSSAPYFNVEFKTERLSFTASPKKKISTIIKTDYKQGF